MKKTQRRLRNIIITLTIICLTPVFEEGRQLSGAHLTNAYAGQDVICAIDTGDKKYSSAALETGLYYELLKIFAEDNLCNVKIVAAGKRDNYIDSLKLGKANILITNKIDTKEDTGITILSQMTERSLWITNSSDTLKIKQLDNWIGGMKSSSKLQMLQSKYGKVESPHKLAEKGIAKERICPYDEIVKKHAQEIGWDWRMLTSIIYHESRFSINVSSHRGAQGLMQVMPKTGKRFGVTNLFDPEMNIIAGTRLIQYLQDKFAKQGIKGEDLIKFTLAAYNAGNGRIIDCRNFARSKGFDNTKWSEVAKVIPLMKDDAILHEPSVKLGKFNGSQTVSYVNNVFSTYKSLCQITSL